MAGKNESLTLGEVVTLQRGTTYKSALLGQPGPFLFGLASIKRNGGFRDDNLKTYGGESPPKLLLRPGDVFVSLKDVTQSADLLGAVARVPLTISSGRVTQDTVKLTFTRKDIPANYIYWLLRTPEYREYCRAHAIGTTNLSISRDDFLAYPVARPSVKDLTLISTLDALDDKIELNRKMNDSLEQIARALFKSWFVDFDPVHAKAAGRQPCGMDKATAGLFPNSFVDSELGKIPKGWEICSLGSTLDTLETGRRPKGGVGSYTSGIPSVGAESINGIGVFDYSKTKYIPQAFFEGISSGRVMHFDVLLYKDGGKPGEFKPRVGMFAHDFPFPVFCINEHVFRMRSDKLGQCFLYFLVSDQRVLTDFANKGGKAAIPGINQPDVKSTLFVNPPSEIISAFNRSATHLCDRIIRNALENKSLADLRDTLLPKLLDRESEPHAQQ